MTNITPKSQTQKGAEAAVEGFRRDLGPFVVAAETTRMPMVFTDGRAALHPFVFANDSFLELTGYARAEVLGKPFDFLLADPDDPAADRQFTAAFGDGPDNSADARFRRKDGAIFWADVFISPVRSETGEVVQHFASFVDVTRHIREQEHLRFLLDELNHRTQNTLATVQAIAAQTLRQVAERDVVETFEGRIMALSKVHGLLGRETWLAVNLRDVIDQILQPFGLRNGEADRFSVEGDDVRLTPKLALTLAMVFQELATNAAKYGALSGPSGKIGLAWTIEAGGEGRRMRLVWQESGGPPVTPPERRGFGTRLIEGGLAQELDGEVVLDYAPAGLTCRIVMPLPKDGGPLSRD